MYLKKEFQFKVIPSRKKVFINIKQNYQQHRDVQPNFKSLFVSQSIRISKIQILESIISYQKN
ncbi:hypothetical protein pb186bvf_008615 [Paramecium bursaria]